MTTKYRFKKRKAVSTVVAAVLLIAITVVAVAVVWTIIMPMLRPQAKIDILEVTWTDTDGDDYADEVTITITNTGTKTVSLDTSQGAIADGLSGDPKIGIDFTRGDDPNTWISQWSYTDRAVHSTVPAPSEYSSLNPGQQLTIKVKLKTGTGADTEQYVRWLNDYTVKIEIFLDDGTIHVEEFTVTITS